MSATVYNPGSWLSFPTSGPGTHPIAPALEGAGFNYTGRNFEPIVRRGIMGGLMPAAFQQLQFGTDNAENNTRLANAAMTLLDPKNNQSRVDRYSRQVQGEARKKSRSVAMEMAAQGFSRSAESAAKLQSENDARSQTNQYASYLDSPEAVTQAINAINQIFTQTSMGPQLQALMGLAGGQQFYKAEKQKGGLLGGLTPLLGMAASAFFDGTGPFK